MELFVRVCLHPHVLHPVREPSSIQVSSPTPLTPAMTRGDQRERARERAAKKQATGKKSKEPATSLAKRKEADAEILREKQRKNDEQKAAAQAEKSGS
ncbi:hypothetical protein V8E55_001017, partial [Tylopilus felleus]